MCVQGRSQSCGSIFIESGSGYRFGSSILSESGSRVCLWIIFALLDPDPDCESGSGLRIRIQGPHWIQIQSGYGSGSTALDAAESWRHSRLPSGFSLMRSSPGPIRRLALIPFPRSAVSNTSATRHSLLWRLQPFFWTQPKHVSALCLFNNVKRSLQLRLRIQF